MLFCVLKDIQILLKNIEIKNLDKISLKNNDFIFHAGTVQENSKIYAVGEEF